MEEKVEIVVLQEERTENRDVCAACERHAPQGHGTMVVPPAYADLGKDAKDIFTKGYGYGVMKLDIKTKSHNGVEFITSGSNNTDTGKSGAHLETKYKVNNLGLSFNQKWTSDNTLTVNVTMEDQLAAGLKLGLDALFVPSTGKRNGKVKSVYRRNHMNLGCDLDFDKAAPTVHAAAVLAFSSLIGGCQMAYETRSKMAKYNWALGYQGSDFHVHAHMWLGTSFSAISNTSAGLEIGFLKKGDLDKQTAHNDGSEFGASIYQKVNRNLEAAVNLAWTSGSNNTRFGIGTKYHLHKDSSLSAKINNSGIVGLGYTRTLRPGVNLSLSAMIDGKNVSSSGHKVGVAFEVEA